MIRRLPALTLLLLAGAGTAAAQTPLTLADAVARARARNLDVRAAAAAERQAEARETQARAGFLPSVELTESWQRSNHPVFVFSSLLSQRRFGAANFAIDALNRPDAIDNLRLGLTVDQAVFDPAVRANVRAATLGREIATTTRAVVAQDLGVAVTQAYGAVLTADAAIRAAQAAIELADADLTRARHRRDAGTVTEADVLQIDVFLARTREQHIRSVADASVARARLNQLMGEPLDAQFALDDTAVPAAVAATALAALESSALTTRPDLKLSALREQHARAAVDTARAAFLPRVSAQGGWEANGGTWGSRASSWTVGAAVRVHLFRGFADRARLAEARQAEAVSAIAREQADVAARLDVRTAAARLDAARAAESVGGAAIAQARESHRIVRDRYDAGLADVTTLLRAAEAVQAAEARHAAARAEIAVAAAALARATGQP